MSRGAEDSNRRMLRARDAMDRTYAELRDPFGNRIRIVQPKF